MTKWHHTSLAVSNVDEAIAFFSAAFGFETILDERNVIRTISSMAGLPGLSCHLVQLRSPEIDQVLELIEFCHAEKTFPTINDRPVGVGAAHICFHVDDLYATLSRIEAVGAKRVGEITEFDEGFSVYCWVPGGAYIEVEQMNMEKV